MDVSAFTLQRTLHVLYFLFVGCVLLAFVNECTEPLMDGVLTSQQRWVLLFTIMLSAGNCLSALTTSKSRAEFRRILDLSMAGNVLFSALLIVCTLLYQEDRHADKLAGWMLRGYGAGHESDGSLFGMFVFGCAFMMLMARLEIYPWPIHMIMDANTPKPPVPRRDAPRRASSVFLSGSVGSGAGGAGGAVGEPADAREDADLRQAIRASQLEFEAERLRRSMMQYDKPTAPPPPYSGPGRSSVRSRATTLSGGSGGRTVLAADGTAAAPTAPAQDSQVDYDKGTAYVKWGDEEADEGRSLFLMASGLLIMACVSYSLHLHRAARTVMLVIGVMHLLQIYGRSGRGAVVLLLVGLFLSIMVIVFSLAFGRHFLPAGGLLLWTLYGLSLLYMERLVFSKLGKGWARRFVRTVRTVLQL